jgi:hypothetical protein
MGGPGPSAKVGGRESSSWIIMVAEEKENEGSVNI